MMELRHLRYFIAVADEASFLRAAARLFISQPPLSMQIRDLEGELGVRLFDRTNRGVVLTAAGSAFYPEVQAVLERVEHARAVARRAEQGDTGRLGIGFVSIADYSVLPPVLKAFRSRYPGVELVLHEETSDVQTARLLDRQIDAGFALGPIDEAGLVFEPLLEEKLILAVPRGHARAGDRRVSLKGFADEAFIMPPRALAPGLHDAMFGFCRSVGFTPRVMQHAKQMQTVVSLVSSGLGVALIPESVRHLRRTGVVYLEPREAGPTVQLGLVRRGQASRRPGLPAIDQDPALRRFIEVTREVTQTYLRAAAPAPATAAGTRVARR